MARSNGGDETWLRLLNWTKEQKNAERLALHLLRQEGYTNLDPSHPLGGKDGTKDAIAHARNLTWLVAVYFPRGQQKIGEIKKKFKHDLEGVTKNNSDGIVFVTNQELRLSERTQLKKLFTNPDNVDLFHLERIASLLDSPNCYGLRLEFLDIEMTKEEQIAFFSFMQSEFSRNIQKEIQKNSDAIIGGDSFCYFDIASLNIDALNAVSNTGIATLIHQGTFPLYNLHVRIVDAEKMAEIEEQSKEKYGADFIDIRDVGVAETYFDIREISPNQAITLNSWSLENVTKKRYIIFFNARNGGFVQFLNLAKIADRWEEAIRVEKDGDKLLEKISANYPRNEFGEINWQVM